MALRRCPEVGVGTEPPNTTKIGPSSGLFWAGRVTFVGRSVINGGFRAPRPSGNKQSKHPAPIVVGEADVKQAHLLMNDDFKWL